MDNIDLTFVKFVQEHHEEAKDAYIHAQDHKLVNFKTKKPIEQNAKPIKIDKKIIAILLGLGVAVGAVAATQVVGTRRIVTAMKDDVKRNDIYITPTNGRITYTDSHQYVADEQAFISEWCEDLYEQGWNEHQIAISLEYYYGIKSERIPNSEEIKNSTFLGRMNERTEAFLTGQVKNNIKGVSK